MQHQLQEIGKNDARLPCAWLFSWNNELHFVFDLTKERRIMNSVVYLQAHLIGAKKKMLEKTAENDFPFKAYFPKCGS